MRKVNAYTKRVLLILAALWALSSASAQQPCKVTENTVFQSGERVRYQAVYNWGFIWLNAGLVTFSVDATKWQDQEALHLKSVGVSLKSYDRLFTVRDTFETWVHPRTLEPFEFRRVTNEGSYKSYHHYLFNSKDRQIRSSISREGGPVERGLMDWPACSYDLVSMVYQARNIDFSPYNKGDKIPITLIVDGEIHNLYIRYLGKEVAELRDGRRFSCLKFSPLLVKGTIFEAGEDMTVWVTDDANRVPIIVEAKILIGSVKAMFIEAEGLRHPVKAQLP
ncbi:DUF3108 domain-containing protein [Geofilum rhodophaeum]|uniref:DUF3108 domain-containing protein n=1 Tax=Geofilum rhodophaeum TaxID=1965019 RepID=UPI000B522B8A|nr:DUF3108 domain-containing protein [Geofilum rhodophaeum]